MVTPLMLCRCLVILYDAALPVHPTIWIGTWIGVVSPISNE